MLMMKAGKFAVAMARSLVGCEDLEARDHLRQWNRCVAVFPILELLLISNEDKEIVIGALEMHLELGGLAASHLDWFDRVACRGLTGDSSML